MKRVTANLSEAQYRWLERFADENGESLSGAVGVLIDQRQSGEAPNEAEVKHEAQSEALAERVDDLEDRVRTLESDRRDERHRETPTPGEREEPRTDTADTGAGTQGPRETRTELEGQVSTDVDGAIDALELPPPDSGSLEEREEALRQAWRLVRDREKAEKSEICQLYPDHAAGLNTIDSWYENLISPHLRELPGIEAPAQGGRYWKTTDEK